MNQCKTGKKVILIGDRNRWVGLKSEYAEQVIVLFEDLY